MLMFRGRAIQGDWEGVTGEVRRPGEKPRQRAATDATGRSHFIEEMGN